MRTSASLMVLSIALMSYSFQHRGNRRTAAGEGQGNVSCHLPTWPPRGLEGKSVFEQSLKEHGKYMLNLYIKGSMKLAGPLTDNAGGAVLLVVAEESEAKAIVAEDPAIKSGIFVYEMHPWKLQPWDEFAKKAKDATQPVAPVER
jgi:uncharacterized protein YciI